MSSRQRGASVTPFLLLILLLSTNGCIQSGNPLEVRPLGGRLQASDSRGPAPRSPALALRSLEWSYDHRSLPVHRRLFSDDYFFQCGRVDSAGTPWRDLVTREDEMLFATHLFVGGGLEPPAAAIRFSLERNLEASPDPATSAWDPTGRWHRVVRAGLTMRVERAGGEVMEIAGVSSFALVRGDSALIPEDLRALGTGSDSTRWYIRRWTDETFQPAASLSRAEALAATPRVPTRQAADGWTLCGLRDLYR